MSRFTRPVRRTLIIKISGSSKCHFVVWSNIYMQGLETLPLFVLPVYEEHKCIEKGNGAGWGEVGHHVGRCGIDEAVSA